jgi:hypothetical protein
MEDLAEFYEDEIHEVRTCAELLEMQSSSGLGLPFPFMLNKRSKLKAMHITN